MHKNVIKSFLKAYYAFYYIFIHKTAEFTSPPFGGCDFHFFISLELVAVMSLEKTKDFKACYRGNLERDMTE